MPISTDVIMKCRESQPASLTPYLKALALEDVLLIRCGDWMPRQDVWVDDGSPPGRNWLASVFRMEPSAGRQQIESLASECCDIVVCDDISLDEPEKLNGFLAQLMRIVRKSAVLPVGRIMPSEQSKRNGCIESFAKSGGIAAKIDETKSFYVLSKASDPHLNGHDISLTALAFGCSETVDWRLLAVLVRLSRSHLGFFPSTIIRTIEYPWFAQRLQQHAGGRILDLGAGVSVLPIWLAENGCRVVTIDNHPLVRTISTKSTWNEWGFLDYAPIHSNITSINANASAYTPNHRFDAVYSVSVLEHIPAEVRRTIIRNMPSWLLPEARVYLSFDLVPGSDDLWPLSEGATVDAAGEHGTIHEVNSEFRAAGFRVVEHTTRRGIDGSRTDLAFLELSYPV